MKKQIIIILSVVALLVSSCEDFLDRPSRTTMNDANFWTTENNLRLFSNGFYANYFVGYNSTWSWEYVPLLGYNFCDDFSSSGKQTSFETQAPTTRGSVVGDKAMESVAWLQSYAGPSWYFSWVRRANLYLERIEAMNGTYLNDEQYKHWSAVARFYRGYEYSRLVEVFGNVPYYDRVILDTETDLLFKDRDSRTLVMDAVYDDFTYVLDNMRQYDGHAQYLNVYIAASFISRLMLFEGTFQKYQMLNNTKAQQYLELAAEAADLVMKSAKYSFTSDFRSLFGSEDLSGNKEVIMYRTYDAALSVTHAIASYSNLTESQSPAANLSLVKSFLCYDGMPYKLSTLGNKDTLNLSMLIATRDPRFEATFWGSVKKEAATLLYADKFIDRVGPTFYGTTYPAKYGSNTNTNDAPVIRYAEVVLNWIEAKAELATLGGAAVTQADIDASINAIRNRPLDAVATGKGIHKTAAMTLATLPDDPDRDPTVPALLWEIRRERRMEFVYEYSRLLDIKRWKKIDLMNGATNPDILKGIWVNFPVEMPDWLLPAAGKVNKLKVQKVDGTVVTYDGTNGADMIGYYIPDNISNRDAFTDRVYMAPVGLTQINQYLEKGYTLTQTTGW